MYVCDCVHAVAYWEFEQHCAYCVHGCVCIHVHVCVKGVSVDVMYVCFMSLCMCVTVHVRVRKVCVGVYVFMSLCTCVCAREECDYMMCVYVRL